MVGVKGQRSLKVHSYRSGVAIIMSSWAVGTLRRVAADIQSFEDGRLPHDAPDTFSLYLELVY